MRLRTRLRNWLERIKPRRGITIIAGDSLPERLPRRGLLLARDSADDWCVGMRCPCGCQRAIELLVIPEAKPRWSVSIDPKGRASLWPSVWLEGGCSSHFWLRSGRIQWCD